MEVFGNDLIFGEFRLSDYGMILSSFEYSGVSEDEVGIVIDTIEEFIGDNPIPVYLGDKYTDKIKLQITFSKDPCMYTGNNIYFSEKECRNILRIVTGLKGYQWLKIISDSDEDDIWYRAKITNISAQKINGKVAGLILQMECDSPFGWSNETVIDLNFKANKSIRIHSNTDDLYNYIYPMITIKFNSEGTFVLNNLTDKWATQINNVKKSETITIDSKHEIIASSISHDLLLNDFNLHWVRLLPDENEFITNMDARITFTYRVPRKVVML